MVSWLHFDSSHGFHLYFFLSGTENRDSGVADVEVCPCQCSKGQTGSAEACHDDGGHEQQIKRSALSNSLLDIHEQCKFLNVFFEHEIWSNSEEIIFCLQICKKTDLVAGDKAQRRGSVGSLDSGMSVSFQSTSASTCSRSDKLVNKGKPGYGPHNQSFLGGLFKKPGSTPVKSTEV